MTENLDLAYFAGFFDGEGSIVISASEGKYHSLTISAAQTYPVPLYRMQDMFGGTITYRERKNGNKPIYDWRAHGYKAYLVLKALREFLIVKEAEADLAIAFIESFDTQNREQRIKFKNDLTELHKRRFGGNLV